MIYAYILAATLACTVNPVHASWSFAGDTCTQAQKDILTEELKYAFEMAAVTSGTFLETDDDPRGKRRYYVDFIAEADRNDKASIPDMYTRYTNIAFMLNTQNPNTDYAFTITCDATTEGCAENGWTAHTRDSQKLMNFCPPFFADGDIGLAIVGTNKATTFGIGAGNILDLRAAQRTRSAIIVHECTHTSYVMGDIGRAVDYAYGFNAVYQLPRKAFNRACAPYADKNKPLCAVATDPTRESICEPKLAVNNADTYSFIAAGVYYSQTTAKDIPNPELPTTDSKRKRRSTHPRSLSRRDPTCPDDDAMFIDGDDDAQ